MAAHSGSTLISKSPLNGEVVREIPVTPPTDLPAVFARARKAQESWAALTPKRRSALLRQFRETLLNHSDELIDLISRETGKPRVEALTSELIPTIDHITYFSKRASALLVDRQIPLTMMKHRRSYLNYWPVGVVAVISPWNFPFFLPAAEIVMALLAGNAVVFKPSEVTPAIGLRIQELADESGLPAHLLQTVIGDGTLGAAVIQQKPDKVFFTGSVATGKKIMAAASEHLIPVNLELGGKDAMIVLPDANLDFATSAALWGGLTNSGQACASVERILLHESIAEKFREQLLDKISKLRNFEESPDQFELGAVTFEKQKTIYERHLSEARQNGAQVIGGEFSSTRRSLKPAVITGGGIEGLSVYKEETFGPVMAMTTFKSVDEAIEKANLSNYGLVASIITKDHAHAERIAKRLHVGTVIINDVLYTAGLPETPWGGVKESGIGRTHSDLGLLEFVHTRHIHRPKSRLFVMKNPWWFPYSDEQLRTFRHMLELHRGHWLDRLRAFPHFLMGIIQLLKSQKRL